jgi:mannose-1-phosphate guanylyltransferase/mannose-6-phosphate isomerase
MFQETLIRLEGLSGLADPIIVCNEAHRYLVAEQLAGIGSKAKAIILEPSGRNTAPAVGVAALISELDGDSGSVLLVLPADHVIADRAAYQAAVATAVQAAEAGNLVTFGVVPTHPETGYGYIEHRAESGDWATIERFVEKPDADTALKYVNSGRFFWNSGMFAFTASSIRNELDRYAPKAFTACQAAVAGAIRDEEFIRLGSEFLDSPSDSIDYAVMEKTDRAVVVRLDAGWSDVGSWSALWEALSRDRNGNATLGDVVMLDTKNSLAVSASRRIVLLGIEDLAVIESGDVVLVMSKDRSQSVKEIQLLLESGKG